jgi:hypothetical protein
MLSGDLRVGSPSMLLFQSKLQNEGNVASAGKIDVSKDRQLSDVPTPPSPKRAKQKDVQWMSNLDVLRQYKEDHGDCLVPRGYIANPRLASWVAEQRKQRKLLIDGKQSSIIPERVKLLDEIGFVWNAQETAWERQLTDLKEFREQEGHCLVPVRHSNLPKLGFWVKEQRRHYVLMKQGKQSHMSDERAAKLDSVGFCWNTQEASWLERFHDLSEYKRTKGHSVVPTKCQETQRLGSWVQHQRREYKKYRQGKPSHMTAERVEALDTLDFVWYPRDRQLSDVPTPPPAKRAKHKDVRWMSKLDVLRQYKEEHGDCVVPRGYSANPRLASWVAEQRKQRKLLIDGKKSSIIPEWVKLLDEIGFVWNAQETAWERQLTDLKVFREQEGHCLVPVGHPEFPNLGSWIKNQRRQYVLLKQGKHSNMSDVRAAQLDAVGFCWNTHEAL